MFSDMAHTVVISSRAEILCQSLCLVLYGHCRGTAHLHHRVRVRGGLSVRCGGTSRSWHSGPVLRRVAHRQRLWKARDGVSKA